MNESVRIELEDPRAARAVFGQREEHLKLLADALTVDIHSRGTRLSIEGDPLDTATAEKVVRQLYRLAQSGHPVVASDVLRAAEMLRETPGGNVTEVFSDTIIKAVGGKSITPKTRRQKEYVDAIRTNDIVFGVGPAGTGKTYLAMAMAVSCLTRRQVKRIILTRPAVEAGEKLGFLPGDLNDKVSPYLRPLYDALHDMLDVDRATELLERGIIEVAPLAFMRGRTLSDAFVILDEAQNATRQQMKMFLTRLGFDSKTVITGDVTQIDLERRDRSGLGHAVQLLEDVPGIEVSRFTEVDVVRHPLVRRIISAYEQAEAAESGRNRSTSVPAQETID
ncbi:MAG: phosphate starvation-inducible PhoH-like protein [Bradymonadia bacterium]|jgi:phosphate starvation-inducible PhoH-like protein